MPGTWRALDPARPWPCRPSWQTLTSGQQTWYTFAYSGDKSEIVVRLSAAPANSASFAVWSRQTWITGSAAEPRLLPDMARPIRALRRDLVWAGSSGYGGTWYVQVKPAGTARTWYSLPGQRQRHRSASAR